MPELEILPVNDRLLVEPIAVKNETKSGLVIIPGGETTIKTTFSTILAVSETLKDSYSVGEIIYSNDKAGVKFRLAGKSLMLLLKGEVLAKIKTNNLAEVISYQDLA